MQKEDQYLSIGEASEYLGVSIDTLRRWAKKAKIPAYRSPGHHRYFKKADLDQVFGTRYERSEKQNIGHSTAELSDLSPEVQEQTTDSKISNIQQPETDKSSLEKEFAIPNIGEELGFPDTPNAVSPIRETDKRDPVNVPRFIHNQNVSKYDVMLKKISASDTGSELPSPDVAGQIEERVEDVKPIVIETEKVESILVPKIPLPIKEVELLKHPKIKVEEVMETIPAAPSITQGGTFDKFIRRVFIAFLIVDAIMFFFWFTQNRLSSPLP